MKCCGDAADIACNSRGIIGTSLQIVCDFKLSAAGRIPVDTCEILGILRSDFVIYHSYGIRLDCCGLLVEVALASDNTEADAYRCLDYRFTIGIPYESLIIDSVYCCCRRHGCSSKYHGV